MSVNIMDPFTTERLTLRPFRADDADALFTNVFGHPEVMYFSAYGTHATINDTLPYLERYIAHQARRGFSIWAVEDRKSGDFIGMCGLIERDYNDQSSDIELGYRLRPEYWGHGLATETAAAWVAHGFETLDLDRIIAIVRPAHKASLHVLDKVGFKYVGERMSSGKQAAYLVLDRV